MSLLHMVVPDNTHEYHFSIYQIGYEKCEPTHFFGPTIRDFYVLHFLVSGKGEDQVRGRTIPLKKGDCFLVIPNEPIFYRADPEDPYLAMAQRLVFSSFNGPVTRRIDRGIEAARQLNADGVVWFCHWGCKHTLGGAQLAKERFEAAGIPCLVLDGDGCDRSHGGEGQMATRMEAFVEMLKAWGRSEA